MRTVTMTVFLSLLYNALLIICTRVKDFIDTDENAVSVFRVNRRHELLCHSLQFVLETEGQIS